MRTKFSLMALAILVTLSLSPVFGTNAISSSAKIQTLNFQWTSSIVYICHPINCALPTNSVTEKGSAHGTFGMVKASAVAICTSPPPNKCDTASVEFSFTTKSGDTIFLQTLNYQVSLTSNPNVFAYTGSFIIVGGTGRFSGATGQGIMGWIVLGVPQVGSGLLTGTITF